MEIGISFEPELGLSFPEQRQLIREAVDLGYAGGWSPARLAPDPFQICTQWSEAAAAAGGAGFTTGISVLPAPLWSVPVLAGMAATTGILTDGRFSLGIGAGSIYSSGWRAANNIPAFPAIAMMRDYLITVRQLLAGETVDHEGKAIRLHGGRLPIRPPHVPVFLGALGPQMLRLAGEAADGAALNWSTPEQVAWSRDRVAEGARRAGRDPYAIAIHEYIRICVDEDEDAARRGLTRALLGYALARPGASKEAGYRGHFARMGFDAALTELEERREHGVSTEEIIEAFPRALLQAVGYYGPASGAAAAFRRLAEGLDIAVVRVVRARPGIESVRAVMQGCAPALVHA
jgi:alkanesulfonate monooxygenase SsuD/methylene tetrahydromethanopterin reductase-like flavin-dependent oxidoreductase (luciferase family)